MNMHLLSFDSWQRELFVCVEPPNRSSQSKQIRFNNASREFVVPMSIMSSVIKRLIVCKLRTRGQFCRTISAKREMLRMFEFNFNYMSRVRSSCKFAPRCVYTFRVPFRNQLMGWLDNYQRPWIFAPEATVAELSIIKNHGKGTFIRRVVEGSRRFNLHNEWSVTNEMRGT